jgi:hypothetical protein
MIFHHKKAVLQKAEKFQKISALLILVCSLRSDKRLIAVKI